jgi:hypothetical protein
MSHPNTKTAPQLEVVEPHAIAVVALFSRREIYET